MDEKGVELPGLALGPSSALVPLRTPHPSTGKWTGASPLAAIYRHGLRRSCKVGVDGCGRYEDHQPEPLDGLHKQQLFASQGGPWRAPSPRPRQTSHPHTHESSPGSWTLQSGGGVEGQAPPPKKNAGGGLGQGLHRPDHSSVRQSNIRETGRYKMVVLDASRRTDTRSLRTAHSRCGTASWPGRPCPIFGPALPIVEARLCPSGAHFPRTGGCNIPEAPGLVMGGGGVKVQCGQARVSARETVGPRRR